MNRIFKALVNYFIKGVLVVVPIGAAIFLIIWIITLIDKTLNLNDLILTDTKGRPIYIPGLGILSILVVIMLAGVIVTNLITEPIYNWFSRLFHRLPLSSRLRLLENTLLQPGIYHGVLTTGLYHAL